MGFNLAAAEIAEQTFDDLDWAERNAHWLIRSLRSSEKRGRRERERKPLILCGHGVSIRVDAGTLLIRNGATHHPQAPEVYRYFKGDLNLPPKIVMLDGSGTISFDVINWLATQNVALFRIDYLGCARACNRDPLAG